MKKKILLGILVLIAIVATYAYFNFNRLLSEALLKSFNANIASDVYELKFEKLRLDIFQGNIKVINVAFHPREKPLQNYPYINSFLRLKTKKIELVNVDIMALLKENTLKLEKIEIIDPAIELMLGGELPVLFPFMDSTRIKNKKDKSAKKFITAFALKEFRLENASITGTNTYKHNQLNITNLNFSLNDLFLDQHSGKDIMSYRHVELFISEITGHMKKGAIKHGVINDFSLKVDSLKIQKTLDTLIFHFTDFSTGLSKLDFQTKDSNFHIAMGPFEVSYKNKSIKMNQVVFKPNISNAAIQKKYKFQHTQFSADIGKLEIKNLNFDSIIYHKKIFIDEIAIDKVNATVFKDKTKPIDKNKFPEYFGQQIAGIKMPLEIKLVKATNVNLVNTEHKEDGSYAKVNINKGTLLVKNITNLRTNKALEFNADAYIENKAHAHLKLGFSYVKPAFSLNVKVDKFNLTDLNSLLKSYTPAKINKGVVDEITFSGMVFHTNSTGTMKFLYHDLNIDLELKNQAQWKNSVLSFTANTVVHTSNPVSANSPPRVVNYDAVRDMNKGFINIILKSLFSGLKETIVMSKENRKAHHESKKKARKEKSKKSDSKQDTE